VLVLTTFGHLGRRSWQRLMPLAAFHSLSMSLIRRMPTSEQGAKRVGGLADGVSCWLSGWPMLQARAI
jgi:hypothetical protein